MQCDRRQKDDEGRRAGKKSARDAEREQAARRDGGVVRSRRQVRVRRAAVGMNVAVVRIRLAAVLVVSVIVMVG